MACNSLVRTLRAAVLCGVCTVACASDTIVNALWNDVDGFGVWLFQKPVNCSPQQYKKRPFVVIGPKGGMPGFRKARIPITELEVCLRATPPDVGFCTGGYVEVEFLEATNQYVGRYLINLSDNTKWEGEFRAQHCPNG